MLDTIKKHYNVAHIAEVTPISFRFYQYNYQILTDEWLWALLTKDKHKIEIYNKCGKCINVINC